MYCEKCGKQIIDNTNKCSFCGTPIDNKMNDTCFTDDDYLTFKVCGILASVAIIGIVIILYVVIKNNNYNTAVNNANDVKFVNTNKTESVWKYDDKYTEDFIFEIDDEEVNEYSREEEVEIIEEYLSETFYRKWYDKENDNKYDISAQKFMGHNYQIKKFSYYSISIEYADLLIILDDGTNLNVNVQYDIFSKYTDNKVGYLRVNQNGFSEDDKYSEYYTMKYDSILELQLYLIADLNSTNYDNDSQSVEKSDDGSYNDENYNDENDDEVELYGEEYILPYSNIEYLSDDDVNMLSKEELRLARNEIFARYGYVFQSEDLQEYFSSKSWYIPDYTGNISEDMLNDYEKANLYLIKSYE